MSSATNLTCRCGQTAFAATGEPITVTECMCDSCRKAADFFEQRLQAPPIRTILGGTACAEYRKDRFEINRGQSNLAAYYLHPRAKTRRVVASCCNTPLWIELGGAHWMGLYLSNWPEAHRPEIDIRTMVKDLSPGIQLPDDIPNRETHSFKFYAQLMKAWILMQFRNPKLPIANILYINEE